MDKVFTISDTTKVLSSLVDEVEQGTRVQIVRAGKPVAILLPIEDHNNPDADKTLLCSHESEIRALYQEIAALEHLTMDTQTRQRIQLKTEELRQLQKQEARRMGDHFKSKTHLVPNAAWTSIRKARALLDRDG